MKTWVTRDEVRKARRNARARKVVEIQNTIFHMFLTGVMVSILLFIIVQGQ